MPAPTAGVLTGPAWPVLNKTETGDDNQVTVAASQTIYQYDMVAQSSGSASQSIALPGSNTSVSLSGGNLPTLGIAEHGVTTDSNGNWTQPGGYVQSSLQLRVWFIDDSLDIWFQLYNATLTNTPITNLTMFTAYQYGRYRGSSSTNWFYVISTTTTNGEMRFIEAYNSGVIPSASNYGWGKFKSILSATVRQEG